MGNRGPSRGAAGAGKSAPGASPAESALVNAQRQNELKQRRKALTSSKGLRMNVSTSSLPDLNNFLEDGASAALLGRQKLSEIRQRLSSRGELRCGTCKPIVTGYCIP